MISLAQALRALSLGFSLLSPVHTYPEGWESCRSPPIRTGWALHSSLTILLIAVGNICRVIRNHISSFVVMPNWRNDVLLTLRDISLTACAWR